MNDLLNARRFDNFLLTCWIVFLLLCWLVLKAVYEWELLWILDG
jgi:hypothetical protein